VAITTKRLPAAKHGHRYAVALKAAGKAPFHWSAVGRLPKGLVLSPTGKLHGTPKAAGTYAVTVKVSDAAHTTDQLKFALRVS
jgi:hypothetical protein